MGIIDKIFRNVGKQQENSGEKVIDLSDDTKYPASVLANLDCTFALGDDSQNFLTFLYGKWTKPVFHWGWKDITHEEAVNSNFLGRAYCLMNSQYEERRDALIAAEGYRFVWRNKGKEPVPGLLTGEQLCEMANYCLETDLQSFKNLNAFRERENRRWELNPDFDGLMADWEKSGEEADYIHRNLGSGMLLFGNRSYGDRQVFIVNPAIRKVYPITDHNGKIIGFTHDDIDWENVNQLEHNGDAKRLVADYGGLSIGDYRDGLARVDWTLYPDGRYFGDSDGFGMEDNDEVCITAFIDTQCRVVRKFREL